MEIILENAGKKFSAEWILRKVNLQLTTGGGYAFIGANGSGKSTLIKLIMGQLPANEGNIIYRNQSGSVHVDDWYRHLVMAAPYLELIEEFTLLEFTVFQRQFKPFKNALTPEQFIDFAQLSHASGKLIRHFSSGMKQRLKLAVAFQTEVPLVFLDEPTSNLDHNGISWYQENVMQLINDRQLVVVGSNQPEEYTFCKSLVKMADYK